MFLQVPANPGSPGCKIKRLCVCCDFFVYHTSEELLKINITSTYFGLGCFES